MSADPYPCSRRHDRVRWGAARTGAQGPVSLDDVLHQGARDAEGC
jgi:hypothetical protein